MLERASAGRFRLLEKDDYFTAGGRKQLPLRQLQMLPATNRQKGRDFLRMFGIPAATPPFSPMPTTCWVMAACWNNTRTWNEPRTMAGEAQPI